MGLRAQTIALPFFSKTRNAPVPFATREPSASRTFASAVAVRRVRWPTSPSKVMVHRPPRFDLLDLRPYVLGEGDLLVKVPCEMVQLLFAQGSYIVSHRTLPSTYT